MLKRMTALVFVLIFLFSLVSAKTIELTPKEGKILILDEGNTTTSELKTAPYINEKGRTMVPLELFTEKMGINCQWNKEKGEVTLVLEEIEVVIDNKRATVNGETKSSDTYLEIIGETVFIPLRFSCEALGYNLGYSTSLGKVILDKSQPVLNAGNTVMYFTEFKALYDVFYSFAYDDAIASGATEEEIKYYAYQAAAETAISFVVMYDTFPGIHLDSEDIEIVKNAIKIDNEKASLPLSGLFALIQEKYYFSKGTPIIKSIINSESFDKYYKENYICAKHILVEDKALAEEILKKLNDGADFDALIKEYGIDPGMKQNPKGYIFTKGEMVEPFENAAFSLKEGEISGIVESSFGYHIIKREALSEASDGVKNNIAQSIANKALQNAAPTTLLMEEDELLKMLGITE